MREVGSTIGIALLALSSAAHADVTHIVQRGHTIEAIAHRYRVSEKAIIDANHLADPKHLKPGQTLVIPGVDGPKKKHAQPDKREDPAHRGTPRATEAELQPPTEPRSHA
ncbi:MAG TPA: LysM domain-containing protein, partial [Polyangiaceae bacterium]|nr:LysM domain-containing protein [Polyangiaceae bacterium]